jgi:uncharacterized protein DUF4129
VPLRPRSYLAALALACALWVSMGSAAAQEPATAPSDAAIRSAVAQLRADPTLGGKHKIRSLHWVAKGAEPPEAKNSALFDWLTNFFNAIGNYGRLIAWALGIIALAAAVIWATRYFARRQPEAAGAVAPLPTHISNLDIRPEGLPADIGEAARAFWLQGQHRQALSLLYRGALSRLVNRFAVPIHASSTEAECVEAAARGADGGVLAYFRELVEVWLRATYAGELPAEESILHLCRNFSLTMDVWQA